MAVVESEAIKNHAAFIWSVADLLRGDHKQSEYGRVILPLTGPRRLDCVLEPTKEKVLETAARLQGKVDNVEPVLCQASGEQFFNTSKLDLRKLLDDPATIADILNAYINEFSASARDILEHFDFDTHIDRLDSANLLYQVVGRFVDIDLHPDAVSNLEMGYLYEELIRKFSELSNETAGEHFTPREVIRLMVNLLFVEDGEVLTKPGVKRTLLDPACGTGGMLSTAEDHLRRLNPSARLEVYGQELNPETYATCRADMMLKGQDASHIMFGNSFAEDGVRTYGFLSQIVSFSDTDLERDYVFCRALAAVVRIGGGDSVDLVADIELTHLRHEKQFEGSVSIDADTGEVVTIFSGSGPQNEPEPETLSTIIDRFNERFGTDWSDADRLFPDAIEEDLVNDERIQLEAAGNDLDAFKVGFDATYLGAIASRLDRNEKVAGQLLDDEELRAALVAEYLPRIYARARVARQRTCPVGELLGADREDSQLEYKSTLRWDIRADSHKTGIPEKAVVKTVAGFLNSEYGGSLLIGVADDGSVYGLEADFATLSKRGQRGDHDLFGQHLQNLLVGRLGDAAASLVTWELHTIEGQDLCRVSAEPADFPVYEGTGDDDRAFWWRFPTGTKAITDDQEQQRIIRRRFGAGNV